MNPRHLPATSVLTSGRLRRQGQKPERFVTQTERPLETLIVIGASAGGHHALQETLKGLSPTLPAAVIVLVHSTIHTVSDFRFEKILSQYTALPIRAVQESGERLKPGTIYVTPPGHSVVLDERTLRLEPLIPAYPVITINRLFASAAKAYHDRVIGVILSGLLQDGTAGLKAVHEAGGLTIVQDPLEAEFSDMPQNAMRDLPVTFCLRLADIGLALDLLARRGTTFETGLASAVRLLKQRVELFKRLLRQSTRNSDTHDFLVIELAALQEDLRTIQSLLDCTLAGGGL